MNHPTIHAFRGDALGTDDATEVARRIKCGDISRREAIEASIERLKSLNPALDALAHECFSEALDAPSPTASTGFFQGVPSVIKDNTDVQGLPTRQGSAALTAAPPAKHHSRVTRQYLAQGFHLLGKSRLPAFGFTASTELAGGVCTRNPWHLGHSSGGSSGGSAALVAAGAVPMAHGNDGGGSIRIPAACCGLVGLKSTRGRLLTSEANSAMPIQIVTEGVLTRTVRDTANFFAQAERYHRNPALPPLGQVSGPNRRRLRIGFMVDSVTGAKTCAETRLTVEHTARRLEQLGHHVEETTLDMPDRLVGDFLLYWAMLASLVRTFGRPLFGPGFDQHRLDPLTHGLADHYRQHWWQTPGMLYQLQRCWRHYERAFDRHDLVLTPVVSHVTPEIGHLGAEVPFETQLARLINYTAFTPANNASGGPAISLPLGRSSGGLPIGMQFSARRGDEKTLLELAFELEAERPFQHLSDLAKP